MLEVRKLQRPGLKSCAFRIDKGESISVTGPSGAGKSLLLRAIADLDPNDGEVYLDQQERSSYSAPHWRRKVCYLAAESGWWSETVSAHFKRPDQTIPFLEKLGLPRDCMSWPVRRLSTGEKQRLSLLRAMVLNPPVLLLDEPTSALDPDSVDAVEQTILDYRQNGGSLILITHNQAQVKKFGPRQLRVSDGQAKEIFA